MSTPYDHHHTPAVASTNAWALSWLREREMEAPTLFTTDHQHNGRGQRNKPWSAEPHRDCSLSLAVEAPRGWTPAMLNMAVALSLRSTLLSVLPNHRSEASVLIKWPNDVVLWHAQTHRKCAGILVENVWRGSEWTHAVIGIGANVSSQRLTRSYRAVSLLEAWQVTMDPISLAHRIAADLLQTLHAPMQASTVLAGFHHHLMGLKERRTFVHQGSEHIGMLCEINGEGHGRFAWHDPQTAPPEWLPSSEIAWVWGQ